MLWYLAQLYALCLSCHHCVYTLYGSGLVCHIPTTSSHMLETTEVGGWNCSICISVWVVPCNDKKSPYTLYQHWPIPKAVTEWKQKDNF